MSRLCIALSLTLLLPGCGGSDHAETAPVTGTVTLNGEPLKNGTIIFQSADSRSAYGKITDGQIVEVTTYDPNDGAPLGSHKVAIFAVEEAESAVVANPGELSPTDANYMGGGSSLIPAQYNNPETSNLTAEIKAGENKVDFPLTSP